MGRGDAEAERLFSGMGRSHLLENELAQRQDPFPFQNLSFICRALYAKLVVYELTE